MGNETIGVVFLVALIALSIAQPAMFYYTVNYPADIGKDWLSRARATNDLNDMARYLQKALDQLTPYNGNPGWPFPTPETDYGQIKQNIQETINNANKWNNQSGTSFGYQQAVQNLQETINEIYTHVGDANQNLGWNPSINFFGYLIIFLWIVGAIIAMVKMSRT